MLLLCIPKLRHRVNLCGQKKPKMPNRTSIVSLFQEASKAAIAKLLELKKQYKEQTGQEYKPGQQPVPAASSSPPSSTDALALYSEIEAQGDLVRKEKAKDAKSASSASLFSNYLQDAAKAAIAKLLELKKQYEQITGHPHKPGQPPVTSPSQPQEAAFDASALYNEIQAQGDLVRQEKQKDAKSKWDVEFHVMLVFPKSAGEGLSDDIYITIPVTEGIAGYRLFNGTHQFGFHSSKADSRGVVVKLNRGERAGLRDCWRIRFQNYFGKYHILLSTDMLDRFVVQEILESKCIAGLIVYDPETNIEPTESLSHDGICPNRHSDVYGDECSASYAWNDRGFVLPDGLRNIDWKMQILYVYNKTHCHDLYNVPKNGSASVSFPLCAASFGVFSTAAGSTEICYRRSKPWSRLLDLSIENRDDLCSPLVGVNILSYLPPKVYKESAPAHTARYLMLSARLDSFGLIPEISPGEISVVTSVIALLAAARTIGMHADIFEKAANASEPSRYRRRSLMGKGEFPRKLSSKFKAQLDPVLSSQLEAIIEVQQLGTGDGVKLYGHADGGQFQRDGLEESQRGTGFVIGGSDCSRWFVGSSDREFPYAAIELASVLSDRIFDSWHSFGSIPRKVRIWENFVKKMALQVDKEFVSCLVLLLNVILLLTITTLFECFIDSPDWFSCDFFKRLNGDRLKPSSGFFAGKSTYVSAGYRNPIRFFVEWLAIYATGSTSYTSNVKDKTTCDDLGGEQNVYVYTWQADPHTGTYYCYRSSVDVYQVNSPAFRIQG
ncbi:WHEP-TRS domain protein [Cooperia oncophora]